MTYTRRWRRNVNDSELIERVAIEVMGWHKVGGETEHWYGWYDNNDRIMATNCGPVMWNPFISEGQMDMVLAKLRERGVTDIICNFTARAGEEVSECSILANNNEYYFSSDGRSMASIKRAILLALSLIHI